MPPLIWTRKEWEQFAAANVVFKVGEKMSDFDFVEDNEREKVYNIKE